VSMPKILDEKLMGTSGSGAQKIAAGARCVK
jgi:hypothetical protein